MQALRKRFSLSTLRSGCRQRKRKCSSFSVSINPFLKQFNVYVLENIYHLVMQCPMHENDRMYDALYDFDPSLRDRFSDSPEKVLYWLLGREIDGENDAYMIEFWRISGNAICNMYRKVCGSRTGVG